MEIPQNLRRKAVAKRPQLGHVVPENQRLKRGGKGGKFILGVTII